MRWECSIWKYRILGFGKNIHLTAMYDFLFLCNFFFQEAGLWQIFVKNSNIFLTSLCMISLFSCHSGKQGCGRYLSKTQRISNNIKIVLHPSLQAAISFSCCFLYHWKFSSNIFFDNIFCAIDKRFQFIFSFLVVNFAQLLRSYNRTSNNF